MLITICLTSGMFTAFLYTYFCVNEINFQWYKILLVALGSFVGYILLTLAILFILSLFINRNKSVDKQSKFNNFCFLMVNEMVLQLSGIKVLVKHREKLNKLGQCIIVCNHTSNYDPMIIANEFKERNTMFISKPSNLRIPLVGPYVHKCGYVPIDRENDRKALETIIKTTKFISANKNISCGVFPEGTRNKSGNGLLEFKSGCLKLAQKTKLPICVLTIKYANEIHKNSPFRRTYIVLDVVDIITPEQYDGKTTIELSDQIRQEMLASLEERFT